MTTFVDTSALYALLDADDAFHEPARKAWSALLPATDGQLITTNYILIETFALVQSRLCSFHLMRRLGLRAAFTFDEDFRQQGFDAVPG